MIIPMVSASLVIAKHLFRSALPQPSPQTYALHLLYCHQAPSVPTFPGRTLGPRRQGLSHLHLWPGKDLRTNEVERERDRESKEVIRERETPGREEETAPYGILLNLCSTTEASIVKPRIIQIQNGCNVGASLLYLGRKEEVPDGGNVCFTFQP